MQGMNDKENDNESMVENRKKRRRTSHNNSNNNNNNNNNKENVNGNEIENIESKVSGDEGVEVEDTEEEDTEKDVRFKCPYHFCDNCFSIYGSVVSLKILFLISTKKY